MKKVFIILSFSAFFLSSCDKKPILCEKCGTNRENLWIAPADEKGTYSNISIYSEARSDYDGSRNLGGDANDVCARKGKGWYLPSKEELKRIYKAQAMGVIPKFEGYKYWSSTQGDPIRVPKNWKLAWMVIFNVDADPDLDPYTNKARSDVDNGYVGYTDQVDSLCVRCIRKTAD